MNGADIPIMSYLKGGLILATLRQRLHRKNATGTYDVIHLETESSLVLRSDGTTVEQAITDLTPTVGESVPKTLIFEGLCIHDTRVTHFSFVVATLFYCGSIEPYFEYGRNKILASTVKRR